MSKKYSCSSTTTGGGLTLGGVLLVIFVVLKLLKLIDWPWIWVLCPLWIPIAIGLVCILIYVLITIIFNRN